jgi:hypothetical protein
VAVPAAMSAVATLLRPGEVEADSVGVELAVETAAMVNVSMTRGWLSQAVVAAGRPGRGVAGGEWGLRSWGWRGRGASRWRGGC